MRPAFAALLACTLALSAAIPAACAAPGSAAEAEAGKLDVSWSIDADAGQRAGSKVQFALARRTANSRWMHSSTRPLADLAGLAAGDIVRLRSHGVTADFIRRVNSSGGGRRSADELVSLRAGGWAER